PGEVSGSLHLPCCGGVRLPSAHPSPCYLLSARWRSHRGCFYQTSLSGRQPGDRPSTHVRAAQHVPVVHTCPGSSLQLVVRLLFHSYAALQISARIRSGCCRRDVGVYTGGGLDDHSGSDHWRRRSQSRALDVDGPTSDHLACHAELLHVSENHGTSVGTPSPRCDLRRPRRRQGRWDRGHLPRSSSHGVIARSMANLCCPEAFSRPNSPIDSKARRSL